MNFSKLYFSLSIFILIVPVSSAQSATIHVPADQPTIQTGIDAATAGDTVLVADGTYTGPGNRDIDFGGKGVVLKSENGPDFTIIDCQGNSLDRHRGFYFHSGEDTIAVVDGFTIRNGWEFQGGGIKCDSSSSPKIINNTISGNSVGTGGGIYCDRSSPTINKNTITGNFADWGGGIYCYRSNPTISNNTISGNSATHGGGIYCYMNSNPTISYNTISGNTGDGIYCHIDSNPTINNNIISGNIDDGISCGASNPTINNNIISGNTGSGIFCKLSNPVITNTIIWANATNQIDTLSSSNPVITYSDIQGGWEGAGNIDADPLLVGPNSNVRSQSPCIDAGDPSILDPDGSRSDIGLFFPEHPE